MHTRVSSQGAPFRMLTWNYPYGYDPSIMPRPLPLRQNVTNGVIWDSKGAKCINGRVGSTTTPVILPSSATITVASNNFATGRVVLLLGNYELVSYLDFQPGGTVGLTATAIAAAISLLPGFSAIAVGAVITINYDSGPMDQIEIRAVHYGQTVNLTPIVSAGGFMIAGSPDIQPPLLG